MFQRLQKKRAWRRLGDWAKRRMGEGILVEFDQVHGDTAVFGSGLGVAAKLVFKT